MLRHQSCQGLSAAFLNISITIHSRARHGMAEAGEIRQPSMPSHVTDGDSIGDSPSGDPTDGDSINDSRSEQAMVGSCDNQLVLADPEVQRGTSHRPPVSPPKFFFDTWNRKTMIWLFLMYVSKDIRT